MHWVIAFITGLAGLIWALNSLQNSSGVSLNPFSAWRRWQFKKTHGAPPLYKLTDPVDLVSVLLLGTAKCKGEVTSSQKARLKEIFVGQFKLSPDEADDQLVAASFLIRDQVYVVDKLNRILEQGRQRLSVEQRAGLLNLMRDVAAVDGPPNAEQTKLIDHTLQLFNAR